MIDVCNLVAAQWDYHLEVADAGMTPAYQVYLISHPFSWFIDPLGGVAPTKQWAHTQQQQAPTQQQAQGPPQGPLPRVRQRVRQVLILAQEMGSDSDVRGSGREQGQ